jgi:predicted N-acetyltransferase YhbS
MARIVIASASPTSLLALNRLFSRAVTQHFSYFPESVQRKVIRDHSIPRLIRATIDPRRVILVAKCEGKIIGYAIGAAPAVGPAQLFWLYVDLKFRGENTGLSLLSRMLKHLAAMGARQVSIATHDHRAYYERQGFKFAEKKLINGVDMDILVFALPQKESK